MDDDFVIFSQFIGNLGSTDSLFVRLSATTDMTLNSITPIRLEMVEMFSSGTPVISFEFTDGNGDYVNHNKPRPDSVFYLDIGNNPLETTRLNLRITKTVMLNQKAGMASQIAFKMFFVHAGWGEFLNKRKNRAWKDALHSEIVTQLVSEAGFTPDVTETSTIAENFVQPYWNDFQCIKYLCGKSMSKNGGHMEFGATLDGRFIYKTTGDMIAEQRIKAKNKKIPVMRMEGQIADPNVRAEKYAENGAPTYFISFSAEEDYMNAVTTGGGGVRGMYFDTMSGAYVNSNVVYSDSDSPQLTDWGAVQLSDENTGVRLYGGRHGDVMVEASNRMVDLVDSINRFEISTERAIELHIGDMLELIIPTPPSINSIVPQNIFYSGFYLVCGISHTVNFNKSTISTRISLMREGFDGKQLGGYTKSRKGKFL